MLNKLIFLVALLFSLNTCQQWNQKNALFWEHPAQQSGLEFSNALTHSDSLSVLEFEYMFNGAGVALGDFNNDGLNDVFFTGNERSCKLFLNKGHLKFEDVTKKSGVQTTGWCYGAAVVDINQDGWSDIYVCKAGSRLSKPEEMRNLFFINQKNGKFREAAAEMNLDQDGYDIQAAFLDYDKDGDLDMYLAKNAFVNYNRNTIRPKMTEGQAASTDKLFRNDGKLHFSDVSDTAGITIEGFALGVNICDLNADNWPDIYVSNDFLTNDLVWINQRNGKFVNQAHDMLRHTTYNGMGNDVADYNNDGLPDIVVVDMLPPNNKRWKLTMAGNTYDEFQQSTETYGYEAQYVRNTLQLNNGDGTFSEIGQLAGIHATEWSWAPLFADFDNDGWKDLFIANGYRQDVTNLDFIIYGKRTLFMGTPEANRKDRLKMLNNLDGIHVPNVLFRNKGDLSFEDVSQKWGFTKPSFSNGTVYGDLDNDGDLDLISNNLDEPALLYENRSNQLNPTQKWLRIKLKGPMGNRDGLGAQVWLWQNGKQQYQYYSPYRGYLSTVEPLLHFGLKKNAPIDSIKILWPDDKMQILIGPKANQVLTLDNQQAQAKPFQKQIASSAKFQDFTATSGVDYLHEEDLFVDFKLQPILPHMHSQKGPSLAVGDVNNDGLDDFFVGAPKGATGKVFLQQKNGQFIPQALPETSLADDMGALFFDADLDGDLDLFVAAGGVLGTTPNDSAYRHRLFNNDGKGNLSLDTHGVAPQIKSSAASVSAADFDRDGDLDLFVAGRVSPGLYPTPPRSFLLKNEQGKFVDITPTPLKNPGMVSTALWTDYNNDGWVDLLLAGEFMPLTFFQNQQGQFNAQSKIELPASAGWWNSLAAGDFDRDGDTDYLAGNLGLNGPYKASVKEPVCVYAKDFDKSGSLDPVMCHFENGKEFLVHSRDDINKQMTPMRGRFKDYTSYAMATLQTSFRADELKDALTLRCETFKNSWIENLGQGKFALHELPLEAQFAPIFGMQVQDFNNDGNVDVWCVGNSYATEVQTGRYDAQGSLVLWGNGQGQFKVDRHAVNLSGDNKSLVQLQGASAEPIYVVGCNSGKLKLIKTPKKPGKYIKLNPGETFATLTDQYKHHWKQEFYYGSTYLSQSTRQFWINDAVKSVVIVDQRGRKRSIQW